MSSKRSRRAGRKRDRNEVSAQSSDGATTALDVSFWNTSDIGNGDGSAKADSPSIPPALSVQDWQSPISPLFISKDAWKRLQESWKLVSSRHDEKLKADGKWLTPTPIQLQSWSVLLANDQENLSLLQMAPTGSGKTLAYGLPLLVHLQARTPSHVMVIVPTRELAMQVQKECSGACPSSAAISILALYGGVDKKAQMKSLLEAFKDNKSIFVAATPGRLLDLLQAEESASSFRTWWLDHIDTVVVDEGDRLAIQTDLCQQVDQILTLCSARRRMVLCSATWAEKATTVWRRWCENHPRVVMIKIDTLSLSKREEVKEMPASEAIGNGATEDTTTAAVGEQGTTDAGAEGGIKRQENLCRIPSHVTQVVHVCAQHKKPRKLLTTLSKVDPNSLGIIFFAKITTLTYIAHLLRKEKLYKNLIELHSHLSQPDREKAIRSFQSGQGSLLLATDLCARGLHVDGVNYVINYDFPGNLEQYVHRCGRAGRGMQPESAATLQADTAVVVYSFFTRQMAPMAPDLISLLRSTNQWVDPNLVELVKEKSNGSSTDKVSQNDNNQDGKQEESSASHKRKRRRKDSKKQKDETQAKIENQLDASDDEDPDKGFACLAADRVVLQRASHVSDASSSDED